MITRRPHKPGQSDAGRRATQRRDAAPSRVWIHPAIKETADRDAQTCTDELNVYNGIGEHLSREHYTVNHGIRQHAVGDVQTNPAES